jgi:4-diphosphocytidyl-2-C-methyl-D-erythritol kinase
MPSRSAPAKINLTLDLLRKRPDGFHELRTVMQSIDLADELTFEHSGSLSFECDDPALSGDDNLVVRAARALGDASGIMRGAQITLKKRIPTAAGLGGGSSDAAACLLGLADLWGIDWPRECLVEIAALLGSDIPFFLWGGTALAEGRGEIITPLPPAPPLDIVLLFGAPAPADKTRRSLSHVRPEDFTDGSRCNALVAAIRHGRVDPSSFSNDLTAPAERAFDNLVRDRRAFEAAGARQVLLAGAGPTQFAVAASREEARALEERLLEMGKRAISVQTVSDL